MARRTYSDQELAASVAEPNRVVRSMSRGHHVRREPVPDAVQRGQYVKSYPQHLIALPVAAVLGLVAGFLMHWEWWLTVGAAASFPVFVAVAIVQKMMKKFATGNVVPAFVVDGLARIAAFADLAADRGRRRTRSTSSRRRSARLAAGRTRRAPGCRRFRSYAGPPEGGAWKGVSPIAVAAGTADPVASASAASARPWPSGARDRSAARP